MLCVRVRVRALSFTLVPSAGTDTRHSHRRARILASGGQIKDDRLYGVLAVARSFGDIALKSKQQPVNLQLDIDNSDSNFDILAHTQAEALTAEPEMSHVEVTDEDEFFVMASDGLWDVCSNQKVVNFVRRRLKAHNCAQRASNDLVMVRCYAWSVMRWMRVCLCL